MLWTLSFGCCSTSPIIFIPAAAAAAVPEPASIALLGADLAGISAFRRHMMEHWQDVLPPGAMLDVQYEDVVGDLEGQARRLLDFCGLPWDQACLSFYETKRAVRTASVAQVRQPIYTRSVGKWRPEEAVLRPLLDGLAHRPS